MQFFSKDNTPPPNPFSEPGIKASIDIGTNTILLLVAEVRENGLHVLHERQRIPRIGRGVDVHKTISMDAMERAIGVLIEYRDYIYEHWGVIPVMVTATSAVRDASNRMEFIWMIEEATGYRVRLLSGQEEAQCTYTGALSQVSDTFSNALVIDIGGGSTELAWGMRESGLYKAISIDAGSVRFTERFLGSGPVSAEKIDLCRTFIASLLEQIDWIPEVSANEAVAPIGVAGTATTIASILNGMTTYDATHVNSLKVQRNELEVFIQRLSNLQTQEILQINPVFMEGRADIILAGCIILDEVLRTIGAEVMYVSTGGIRHGALLEKLYG